MSGAVNRQHQPGIGIELAKFVHAKDAKVLIADLRLTPKAESLVDGKTAIYLKTDVAKWSELENIVTVSKDVFGDVPDVYVAGAAVFEPVWLSRFVRLQC
jgi:NAD(P)-dependent dehydrogenase (short-subunit alcohol dehydrogenase family)